MDIGPVEYIVVVFPDNKFTGAIAPELGRLIEAGLVRILDLTFISKDADGAIAVIEFDQLDEFAAYSALDGEVGGLLTEEDVEHAAALLEPNSSAALIIWEDIWARPLAEAILSSGGVLVEGARVPHDLVQAAFDELAAAD
jgi:hypothetical protein